MPKLQPVLLVVLDGWGIRAEREANAIAIAGTPSMDALVRDYPHTALETSGLSVGLPEGQMGNSEVGHINLGAGRIVYQDLTRINRAVEDGDFFDEPGAPATASPRTKAARRALHLIGLLSDGGVHSHDRPPLRPARAGRGARASRDVFVHAFLDGRDTPPASGARLPAPGWRSGSREIGDGKVATVMRPLLRHGPRQALGPGARRPTTRMVLGEGEHARRPAWRPSRRAYARRRDRRVREAHRGRERRRRAASARSRDGDAVIFFNFRADRAREITRALADPDFNGLRPRRSGRSSRPTSA